MAETEATLVACPTCDLLFDVGDLRHGQKANCSRCGDVLTRVRDDNLERVQAFTISGLVCLVISCSFPFLSFKSKGLESVMTLPQTAWKMYEQGMPEIGLVVAAFILIIPAAVMLLVLVLTTCMAMQQYFAWMTPLAHAIFKLRSWAMVDVFFIGVLVSLIKIAHMATVVIGISFWGYAAFSLFFVLTIANMDTLQYWTQLERLAETSRAH